MKTYCGRKFVVLFSVILPLLFLLGLGGLFWKSPVLAAPCGDSILRVDKSANGTADGCSWQNAYPNLQSALEDATPGDEIWVAGGVYTPGTTVSDTFQLLDGVSLYGGFAATETVRAERDWQANLTVLSGDIDGDDIADVNGIITSTENILGENTYNIVDGSNVSSTTTLDGFIITGGKADGYPLSDCYAICGGGIIINNGSPKLSNLIVIGNWAREYGGGMVVRNASPVISNTIITNNYSNGFQNGGGGIAFWQSSPILLNVTVSGNSAYIGGGIYNSNSYPLLTNLEVISNLSWRRGGGMYNYRSNMTVEKMFISDNVAGYGGGIYNSLSESTWTDVKITHNRTLTSGFGGGIYNDNSNTLLKNVTISGNSSYDMGGGIFEGTGNLILINVELSGNSASHVGGGGIFNAYSALTMTNVTVSGNFASTYGGGVYNDGGNIDAGNSVIWGNGNTNNGTITNTVYLTHSSRITLTNSLLEASGGSTNWIGGEFIDGGNNLDVDPLFVLPVNLAFVPTIYGNLHLREGSPVIDAGDNALLPPGVTFDLDGNPRIVNGLVDMGPYEGFQYLSYLPIVLQE